MGDILEEAERINGFVGRMGKEEFLSDFKTVYAVEKALQNIAEACIQLNGKKQHGARFQALFPDHDFTDIKDLGNKLRHDYGALDAAEVWETVLSLVPVLRSHAQALLEKHRRLHGGS